MSKRTSKKQKEDEYFEEDLEEEKKEEEEENEELDWTANEIGNQNKPNSSKQEESPVILGYLDEHIGTDEDNDKLATKFGGIPVWILNQPPEKGLKCSSCNRNLFLVLQAYAPLDHLPNFHRILYLFACNSSKCSNSEKGWVALRCQVPFSESELAELKSLQKEEKTGNETTSNTQQKSTDLDDEWGIESQWASNNSNSDDLEELLRLRDQSLNENKVTGNSNDSSNNTSKGQHKEQMKKSTEESNAFAGRYIVVEYEPPDALSFTLEKELMSRYKAELNQSSGEKWLLEQYESDQEKSFMKFQRRIKRNPEQCLRYSFKGNPLWISDEIPKVIPKCTHCGSERVFELQLLPTLLYLHDSFKPNNNEVLPIKKASGDSQHSINQSNIPNQVLHASGNGIEFGTVSLYSCLQSCQLDKTGYHTEYVFVQPAV